MYLIPDTKKEQLVANKRSQPKVFSWPIYLVVFLLESVVYIFFKHNQYAIDATILIVSGCMTFIVFKEKKSPLSSWFFFMLVNGISLQATRPIIESAQTPADKVLIFIASTLFVCLPSIIVFLKLLYTVREDNLNFDSLVSKFEYFKSLSGNIALILTVFNFYIAIFDKGSITLNAMAKLLTVCIYPSSLMFLFSDIFIKERKYLMSLIEEKNHEYRL